MRRLEASFISAGEQIAAWLYPPDPGASGSDGGAGTEAERSWLSPCVVMAHGLGGVREAGLEPYAERFAAAGIWVLLFDYRFFGGSTGEPRQQIDIGCQLEDWRAALAYARGLEGVDPDRVGAWGTSFSGGHVITLGAEDGRLAAIVAQNPMADGIAALRMFSPKQFAATTWAAIRDEWARLRGAPRVYLPLTGRPGEAAGLVNDEAVEGYGALIPERTTFQNRYTAGVGLRVGAYRPIRGAGRIKAPVLVCVTDGDRITPPGPAARVAELAPRGEARHYPARHFDIYVGEHFERAVTDQTEFLVRSLSP